MSQASDMVAEFYAAFPNGVTLDVAELCLFEEIGELDEALDGTSRANIARELADVVFTCYGVALAHRIDLDVAFAAVAEANLAKLAEGKTNGTGKLTKPKGWQPPSMKEAL